MMLSTLAKKASITDALVLLFGNNNILSSILNFPNIGQGLSNLLFYY